MSVDGARRSRRRRIESMFLLTVLYGLFSMAKFENSVQISDGNNSQNTTSASDSANHATNSITTEQQQTKQIPKIVHQEWKSTTLPQTFKIWRDECIRINPDYEFKVWTDDDNLQLVTEHYPQLLDLYNGYDVKIKRIDMIRFLYLHKVCTLNHTCVERCAVLF